MNDKSIGSSWQPLQQKLQQTGHRERRMDTFDDGYSREETESKEILKWFLFINACKVIQQRNLWKPEGLSSQYTACLNMEVSKGRSGVGNVWTDVCLQIYIYSSIDMPFPSDLINKVAFEDRSNHSKSTVKLNIKSKLYLLRLTWLIGFCFNTSTFLHFTNYPSFFLTKLQNKFLQEWKDSIFVINNE